MEVGGRGIQTRCRLTWLTRYYYYYYLLLLVRSSRLGALVPVSGQARNGLGRANVAMWYSICKDEERRRLLNRGIGGECGGRATGVGRTGVALGRREEGPSACAPRVAGRVGLLWYRIIKWRKRRNGYTKKEKKQGSFEQPKIAPSRRQDVDRDWCAGLRGRAGLECVGGADEPEQLAYMGGGCCCQLAFGSATACSAWYSSSALGTMGAPFTSTPPFH